MTRPVPAVTALVVYQQARRPLAANPASTLTYRLPRSPDRAGRSVEGVRGGRRVAGGPGAEDADRGAAAGRQDPVPLETAQRHGGAGLGVRGVPGHGDALVA